MPETFRLEIDDEFITGLICAVCAAPALRVHHIPNYADYVSCEECGSSFVVEDDGMRVLYGKISEEYSDTGKVVLKNWVTLSVVSRLASAERERRGIGLPEDVRVTEPLSEEMQAITPAAPTVELPREMLPDILPQVEVPEAQEIEAPPPPATKVEEAPPRAEEQPEIAEPIPEKRYRVRIKDEAIYVPMAACAHCFNAPANNRITITGSLPTGVDPVTWRRANFRLPLCDECRKKSTALSSAQKNAQLQAHLISMLVGMALFVAAIGLGVVDLGSNMAVGLLLLAIIAAAGYALPLGLLLPRARRAPPLREAYFIETTLRVREPEDDIAESYFDFRNVDYAKLFWESNPHSVEGQVEDPDSPKETSEPEM